MKNLVYFSLIFSHSRRKVLYSWIQEKSQTKREFCFSDFQDLTLYSSKKFSFGHCILFRKMIFFLFFPYNFFCDLPLIPLYLNSPEKQFCTSYSNLTPDITIFQLGNLFLLVICVSILGKGNFTLVSLKEWNLSSTVRIE